MANSATALTAIPCVSSKLSAQVVTPVVVVIDTTGEDLVIYTPGANNYAAIVGCQYKEATAHNLTVTSGSTAIAYYENAANSGVQEPVRNHYLIVGSKGEALKVQSSAAVGKILFYVVEVDRLVLE